MPKVDTRQWVVTVPCEDCPEGKHVRWAAAGWVPWSNKGSALRHLADLAAHGISTTGMEVVEAPSSPALY